MKIYFFEGNGLMVRKFRISSGDNMTSHTKKFTVLFISLCFLIGCQGSREVTSQEYSGNIRQSLGPDNRPGLLGDSGLSMDFGKKRPEQNQSPAIGIGVNAYLWRAALDTLSFMPLQSADPFGGVIITNWWRAGTDPNEQFKATVYILSSTLRSDGLKVSVFRQIERNGQWSEAFDDKKTSDAIENKILSHALELRSSSSGG